MNLNPLAFQYALRGNRLADLSGQMLAAATEQRDRELEDYLGGLAGNVTTLTARVDAITAVVPWTTMTLTGGWIDRSGTDGSVVAGYRKIGDLVYLRGRIQSPASPTGTTIATLPVGYRPPGTVDYPTDLYNGTTWVAARFYVGTNGAIVFVDPTSAGAASLISFNVAPFSVTP